MSNYQKNSSQDILEDFINKLRNQSNKSQYEFSNEILNLEKLNDSPTYIYGAGEAAHWFYEIALKTNKMQIVSFIDQNEEIKSYKEYPCIGLKEISKNLNSKKEVNIVVCVGSFSSYKSIERDLREIGFKKIYYHGFFFEVQYLFYHYENQQRIENWPNIFSENIELIKKAYSMLSDQFSKNIYIDLLYSFYYKKSIEIQRSERDEQYFPRDIPNINIDKHSKFLICGAYDGDSIRSITKKYSKIDRIIGLEPDPEIYSRLKKFIDSNSGIANKIDIEEKAIGLEVTKAKFKTGSGLGSKISTDGNILVNVTNIDSLMKSLGNPSVDLITMDIEGQELDALVGAKRYISEHHPSLGVCTYHRPEHLWQIPNEINKISDNYKIYLRNYTSFITESVYYACL